MNTKLFIILCAASLAVLAGCAPPTPDADQPGLPNPAAVYCEEQGHTHEIRTDAAGNQYGVCVFAGGGECDAWAYFRGECSPPATLPPATSSADIAAVAAGNNAFALDLLQRLRSQNQDANLFYSPYSISLALAMTFAGAGGETAAEMAQALHFPLPQESLHPAFSGLAQALAQRAEVAIPDAEGFQLRIANALWGQQDYPFLPAYLDQLASNYGAGVQQVDFSADPEAARGEINDWVSDQTEQRIQDLLPAGSIDTLTRLVLANAIYFKAAWLFPFTPADPAGLFTRLDGSSVATPMMSTLAGLPYAAGEGVQAVELPYMGDEVAMTLFLPEDGAFDLFLDQVTPPQLAALMAAMTRQQVQITLPLFTYESSFSLKDALMALGMDAAFAPGRADFSGMAEGEELAISDVFHKAFVAVDEKGTEAAAATAVIVAATSMPQIDVTLTIDRPFLFLIHDKPTGAILFAGVVLDPAQK
ncbi:MAG: DUF333 domain-containing protein [Caldilineales bacterium]|nr:DUF333 domain-containing protein [Caldilineales bacterium]